MRDAAQRTVREQGEELANFGATLRKVEARYSALERQHELLLDTEHSLRVQLQRAAGGSTSGGEGSEGLKPECASTATLAAQVRHGRFRLRTSRP